MGQILQKSLFWICHVCLFQFSEKSLDLLFCILRLLWIGAILCYIAYTIQVRGDVLPTDGQECFFKIILFDRLPTMRSLLMIICTWVWSSLLSSWSPVSFHTTKNRNPPRLWTPSRISCLNTPLPSVMASQLISKPRN